VSVTLTSEIVPPTTGCCGKSSLKLVKCSSIEVFVETPCPEEVPAGIHVTADGLRIS